MAAYSAVPSGLAARQARALREISNDPTGVVVRLSPKTPIPRKAGTRNKGRGQSGEEKNLDADADREERRDKSRGEGAPSTASSSGNVRLRGWRGVTGGGGEEGYIIYVSLCVACCPTACILLLFSLSFSCFVV